MRKTQIKFLASREHTTRNGITLDCGHILYPGESYGVWVGLVDGRFTTHHECPVCEREAFAEVKEQEREVWVRNVGWMPVERSSEVEKIVASRNTGERVQCIGVGPLWYLLVNGKVTGPTFDDAWGAAHGYRRELKRQGLGLDKVAA